MRMLFGMIVGALLIVGVAFVADNWQATSGASERRAMVNWDVVGENLRVVRRQARDVWTRLSQGTT